jgi:hypothetical protein
VSLAPIVIGTPMAQADTQPAMAVGAAAHDWTWFDKAIGPLPIYRIFDSGGFHYDTWQQTPAYQQHPNAPQFDYSFDILPQRLTDPNDPINAQIRAFLATTPKNLIITDYHEPDYASGTYGLFTPAQFRAGILALANMVRAQNAIDGGHRMTSVILMTITFAGNWSTSASDWWPTDARDGGHVDLIEGDMYEWPHATNTLGVPPGYTDGVKWRSASQFLAPLHSFAVANNTPWAIAELGILEDIHDPVRRANELANAVAYARANGALHVCYFDNIGPHADWRLRWGSPVGTASPTSDAAVMWKSLVNGSVGPPTQKEWVLNPGFDGGSITGWSNPYSPASQLAVVQQSTNWVLSIGNKTSSTQDVGTCNQPFWVNAATVSGLTYTVRVQAQPTLAGTRVRLGVRETGPSGNTVTNVQSVATLTDAGTLTSLPATQLAAVASGDTLRVCLAVLGLPPTQKVYADNFSITSPA